MKRPVFFLVVLLFAGAGFNCRPSKVSPQPVLLTGKLVVNGPCGFYAVQVLSGNVDSSRLVKSWKYTSGDTTFSNVFMVSDACTFGGYGLSKNDEFTFEMNDTTIVQNCMLCMIAWPPTPAISNTVSKVQLVKKGQ